MKIVLSNNTQNVVNPWNKTASRATIRNYLKNIRKAIRYHLETGNDEKIAELEEEREIFLKFRNNKKN